MILAAFAVGFGFRNSIEFFKSPTQIFEGDIPTSTFRVGGLVVEGSIRPSDGGTYFKVTDMNAEVEVFCTPQCTGQLTDLFSEGQGSIAKGKFENGIFIAEEVLAKHDETYMPKEVADALKEQGVFKPTSE